MNKLVVIAILAATVSLLISTPSLANAQIKVTPPTNWRPLSSNNSTQMTWIDDTTKSGFMIAKKQLESNLFHFNWASLAGPALAKALENRGLLESADPISLGSGDSGYRYFLKPTSLSSTPFVNGSLIPYIPKEFQDVPFKWMFILTQKQDELYGIVFGSQSESFASVLNEIKPTMDSIQLGNSTTLATNQTSESR